MAMRVAVLVYDEAEVLDFAGPYEAFSTVNRVARRDRGASEDTFEVFTVAREAATVRAREGFLVQPRYDFRTAPRPDILVVPGGVHTAAMACEATRAYVAHTAATATHTLSVCTGAFILAAAGLLDGRRATTHWEDLADLAARFPGVEVVGGVRWVDAAPVFTSEGVAAGIDLSLHLVERITDRALADATARQMCYERRPRPAASAASNRNPSPWR